MRLSRRSVEETSARLDKDWGGITTSSGVHPRMSASGSRVLPRLIQPHVKVEGSQRGA